MVSKGFDRSFLFCVVLGFCAGLFFVAGDALAQSNDEVSLLRDAAAQEEGTPAAPVGLAAPLSVNSLFGSAGTSVAVSLPPGRKGLTPPISLQYSSNRSMQPVGYGWDLSLGCIERNTRQGTPRSGGVFDDSAGFVLRLPGGGLIDLDVNLGSCGSGCTSYGSREEEAALRVRFYQASNYWEVEDTTGTVHTLGEVESARGGDNVANASGTFRWHLTKTQDRNGNRVDYSYNADFLGSTSNYHTWVYPQSIHYGGHSGIGVAHPFHVFFEYQSLSSSWHWLVTPGGYQEWGRKLLAGIRVEVDAPSHDPTMGTIRKRYRLNHVQHTSGKWILDHIQLENALGNLLLPKSSFTYQATGSGLRLKTVDNGYGATWSAQYIPWSSASSGIPFPLWVVDHLILDPGVGTGSTQRFSFASATFVANEGRLYGFAQNSQTADGVDRIATQYLEMPREPSGALSHSRALRPVRSELRSAGVLLVEDENNWEAKPLGDGRYQLHPTRNRKCIYGPDGSQLETISEFLAYDADNNPLIRKTSGTDLIPIQEELRYSQSPSSCRSHPDRVQQYDASGSSLTRIGEQQFDYDAKCNPTKEWALHYEHGQSASQGTLQLQRRWQYDAAIDAKAAASGLPTKITDARGNTSELRYDTTYGLYARSLTTPLGQVEQYEFDPEWGALTKHMDANGVEQTRSYDRLGRRVAIKLAGDSLPWRKWQYHVGTAGNSNYPPAVAVLQREPNGSADYRPQVYFFDGAGRSLGQKRQQMVNDQLESSIFGVTQYDEASRPKESLLPYAGSHDLLRYDLPNSFLPRTQQTFDSLDRATLTTAPDGTQQEQQYPSANVLRVRDANWLACGGNSGNQVGASCPGMQAEMTRDAAGRTRTEKEYEGTVLKRTVVHSYNALGQEIQTTILPADGSAVQITRREFDSLGRVTAVIHADSGRFEYGYDDGGLLIYENDPKLNQHREFCYDENGRRTREGEL